ncbi:hypothetical protein [Rhizobium sp. SYY.PMSO]|uniref:hypothetical protein n=1 Tax=Rhizobium sp. SYY.PMSO TaxID=3382192 RepID=UPI0013AFF43A
MKDLQAAFITGVTMLSKLSPLEKYGKASEIGSRPEWQPLAIFERLKVGRLKDPD